MKSACFIFGLFWSLQVFAQQLPIPQLRTDFDTLRHSLEEAHGGLYRHHSKPAIDRLFTQYRKKLKAPMTHLEFYGFLSKLLANIGDGHMKLDLDESFLASQPRPLLFPFQVLIEKNKAIILTNDTKDDSLIKPGMELVSINGRTIKKVKPIILSHLISDGFNETKKAASLERNFSQLYRVFIDTACIFNITIKDSSGKRFTNTVKGVLNPEREANRNTNPVNIPTLSLIKSAEGNIDNLSLRFIDDSIAYLRVRYFIGPRFNKEVDSLFAIIAKQRPTTMLLDLRGNGGGLDQWGAHLASKFATKPFRYIEKSHARGLIPSFADWKHKPPVDLINGARPDPNGGYFIQPLLNSALSEQQPGNNPFTGKLVVLVNGRTFSAASDFASIVSNLTNAVFVGEETGGGYQGNTSALNAIRKLPHSKLKVTIHLWDLWSAVKPPAIKSRGKIPDHYVERKPADWLHGIDTQFEFALRLCRGG
jgi:hypothetical protein